MPRLNDLDNDRDGVPFPPSRLLLHDDVQLYYRSGRAAPEDTLCSVTDCSRPLVLLLAPGDPRSLLYTLYRNFDPEFRGRFEGASFLVNENWSLLQAREILMLHLCLQLPQKLESQEGRLLCAAIWAIFYCSTLQPPHLQVLREAARSLSRFGRSLEAWNSSENPLGRVVRFRDKETFVAIARHWKRWDEPHPKGVPPVMAMADFRADFLCLLHLSSMSHIMARYSERCLTYMLGLSADVFPLPVQRRMKEEFFNFIQSGSAFAEDVLELPVHSDFAPATNLTFFDGSPHSKIHNPFYGQIPFLGFFHSFLFSPSHCREGNVARSLTDKFTVADEMFDSHPLLANSVQQLVLWLSSSSRALRKITSQSLPL